MGLSSLRTRPAFRRAARSSPRRASSAARNPGSGWSARGRSTCSCRAARATMVKAEVDLPTDRCPPRSRPASEVGIIKVTTSEGLTMQAPCVHRRGRRRRHLAAAARSTASRNCFSAGGSPSPTSISGAMAGKFITFEGGEGAGKSTQIRRLAARLAAAGIAVVTTREPGGTPAAEAIRQFLLSRPRRSRSGAEGEALLFAAARADHVDARHPAGARRGRLGALATASPTSTRVYQGADGGVDAGDSSTRSSGSPSGGPGRTSPSSSTSRPRPGFARVRARQAETGVGPDRFEQRRARPRTSGGGRPISPSPPANLSAASSSTQPAARTRSPTTSGGRVGAAPAARRLMAMADRRDPAPRRARRLAAAGGAAALVRRPGGRDDAARRLSRRPDASRLAARRAEGHRQGDARLPLRPLRLRPSRSGLRGGRAATDLSVRRGQPGLPPRRRPRPSQPPRPASGRGTTRTSASRPSSRSTRSGGRSRFFGSTSGRGGLAHRHRRPRRRHEPERRQRAPQGARGAADALALPRRRHAPGRLLPTIRSRCRRLDLAPLLAGGDRRRARATMAAIDADDADIALAAALAEGSLRRAILLARGGRHRHLPRLRPLRSPTAGELDVAAMHALRRPRRGDAAPTTPMTASSTRLRAWLGRRVRGEPEPDAEAAPGRRSGPFRLPDGRRYGRRSRSRRPKPMTYNLDRKQVVLSILMSLARADTNVTHASPAATAAATVLRAASDCTARRR